MAFCCPPLIFMGQKFENHFRVIWRHWPLMTQWFHDLISSPLSVKWMFDSKSTSQITLKSSRTRKKSAKFIDLIWPQLTSVDLHRTGWPVESLSTTLDYMSTFISLAKTAMLASYVPRNAFSAWHDPSYDVMGQRLWGSGPWNFQGGHKKMFGKLYKNLWHSTGKQKRYSWKTAEGGGGVASTPLCRRGLSLYTNRFVLWQATRWFFPRSSSSLIGKSARLSIFCHFDILHSIFCHFDILSFDILSPRYFAFRYFATSIFSHFDILLSIFCLSIFCTFDILHFDILHFRYFAIRYFAIRYFAISIFCPIDILRIRYFATSIFCLSIYFFRYFAIRYFAIRYFVLEAFKHPPAGGGKSRGPAGRGLKKKLDTI